MDKFVRFHRNSHIMTLKQLEAFYWAATCPTFAVAAEKISLSVSSLSKRISELEVALDQPLFDRDGHRAVLLEAGAVLLPRARELLTAADRLVDDMRRAGPSPGRIRIGAGELTAMTWLAPFIRRIQKERPNVALEAVIAVGGHLEEQLSACELDLAIVAAKSSNPAISSAPISAAHFSWYVAEGVGSPGTVRQALFDRVALISLPIESGITRLVDDWLRAREIVPSRRIICNHWGAVANLLREGLGVGVLPRGWASGIAGIYGLRALSCKPALPSLEYFVQWRSDDYRGLVSHLRRLAKGTVNFENSCL